MKHLYFLALSLMFPVLLFAQDLTPLTDNEADKCGSDTKAAMEMLSQLGDKWGYSYDSLLLDLNEWGASDYVNTSYIGESTQGREIWELTITDSDYPDNDKHRIYVHARTHPGEVQAFWVTDEMINYLLGDTETAALMRSTCIFHIVPMYNPDGVELEKPRENANDIDIESNWNTTPHEIEVQHLKARFTELMGEYNPIEIALNMHSAVACKRYFVYHHSNGTSPIYADMQEDFIMAVWNHFPDGMEPYNYYVSWTSSTPKHYPESFWWLNYGDEVVALTYEDMNCEANGDYDKAAFAIMNGIVDYLRLASSSTNPAMETAATSAYPNPFNDRLSIEWNTERELQAIQVIDITGRQVYQQRLDGSQQRNIELHSSEWSSQNSGIYFLNLVFSDGTESLKLIKN